jgi:hypothetical protein
LKAREEAIQKVLEDAHKSLSKLTTNEASYKELLRKLILQVKSFEREEKRMNERTYRQ